ncbi:NADPH-dependent aldehyde reductase 1, chloroplastic-like isoform X1 [Phaseolus vulgaris]|uniref:NADPH-dependent aldehyde reductase 1, chloroplastic-like isoform X1 n=1 Tax=Phaseolus vulgaris TaxID=3885 RepID=UPI0035CB53A9
MASTEYRFPPQKQYTQPGKEYLMNPPPQYSTPDYKPSNKLQIFTPRAPFSSRSSGITDSNGTCRRHSTIKSGKIAVITGGDSGIGRAVCNLFSLEGATVIFTYVEGQEDIDAKETLEIIRNAKTADAKDPMAIPVNLGYEENCKRVVDEVVSAYGCIDILVNNAAVQFQSDSLEEIDDKRLHMVFRTNIFSYFFMTKYALKHMKEGSGIINTTSVVAYEGHATLVDYASTKGAIVGFTRSLALQLVRKGIRVNGVAPGPIWTPLQVASFTEEQIVVFGSDTTMKRAGQPIEVAPSYVFLASNQCSSYITGQVLHPNGGSIVNT